MSKISVLMSVYKKENPEYLRASLESVLVQTRTADEILLIEDGPLTQELYQVVAEYQKKCDYLHVHAMEQNVQLGRALAKGVELCQYDLIARMDTDDIAMPDRLEKEGAYMEAHPEVDVVTGISVPEHGRYTCPGENKHGISKAKKWMGLLQGFSKT